MRGTTSGGADDSGGLPRLTILGGRHQLTVGGLTLAHDSFTIRYTITPPLPADADAPMILLVFEAEDDLGREYVDWGGAYGPGVDGTFTDGSVTGQPAVPSGVHTLRARITFLRGGEEFPYEFTLPVPLR
ncbi:hypothetical protein [Streptomyces sp. NPDC094032]|uniref:hypothetical protein n=1 Tax=Streptomyces sp. NPDC094032 TaxID=3155308 RepID=UPI00331C1757